MLMLRMVVMMMMRMMVMVMSSLRSLVASLRQAWSHAAVKYLCFTSLDLLSRPTILLSSTTRLGSTSTILVVGTGIVYSFHIS